MFVNGGGMGMDNHAFGYTGMVQLAIGLGDFSISTRHMRQFPSITKRGW